MANYYEEFVGQEVAKVWKDVAEELAKQYGTDPEKFQATSLIGEENRPISEFADKFEDHLNEKLLVSPVNNTEDPTENIKKIGAQIGKDLKLVDPKEKMIKEARLREITSKIGSQTLIEALKETTKESDSLVIEGLYNGDLNNYWNEILVLLPNLKKLTIKGDGTEKISIGEYSSPKISTEVLKDFRTKLVELELPDNAIYELYWLKKTDADENISLRKVDLTRNKIDILKYEDLKDLPENAEVIFRENSV
ncbi:MAG: hypothetical protein LBO09_06770 [Candidatus Peribacteria bacterium]|jgi:hypothetical protein|nr:hypothetical protein [Candidatus Peribacteria bacterium]